MKKGYITDEGYFSESKVEAARAELIENGVKMYGAYGQRLHKLDLKNHQMIIYYIIFPKINGAKKLSKLMELFYTSFGTNLDVKSETLYRFNPYSLEFEVCFRINQDIYGIPVGVLNDILRECLNENN